MSLRIRLARYGAKKKPFYRIVVAPITSPRDGKFIERLGSYDPMLKADNENRITLNEERIKYWLGQGAQPTERVEKFLAAANIIELSAKSKSLLEKRAKAAAEKKAAEEAAKKAEAAAAAE